MSYLPDKTFENVKAQVGSSVSAQTWTFSGTPVRGEAKLHQHQLWEGAAAPFEFYPSVSCTSVLDGTP